MSIDVVCTGILIADHLCSPIDRLPAPGELILCDELPLAIGGCPANLAVDLARLAVKANVVGCVGDDALGRFLIESLEQQGVDAGNVRALGGCATGGSLILNVRGQDRRYITTMGANDSLSPRDIPLQLLREAKVFYVGGYLVTPGLEDEGLVDLFRQARAAGAKTVLDVVVVGGEDHWARLEGLLPETDVFLPNRDEAKLITGLDDPLEQAEEFSRAGAGTVAITDGEAGAVLVSGDARLRSGIYPVDYVGGTGSGDAFSAGYILGLLEGGDTRACLQWGSAIGASCVRSVNASEGVFNRAEAEAFMREHRLEIEEI